MTVPNMTTSCVKALEDIGILCLPQLVEVVASNETLVSDVLEPEIGPRSTKQALQVGPWNTQE